MAHPRYGATPAAPKVHEAETPAVASTSTGFRGSRIATLVVVGVTAVALAWRGYTQPSAIASTENLAAC